MAKKTRIQKIKIALLQGKIFFSSHSKERLYLRGYDNVDVMRAILNGKIVEVQRGYDNEAGEQALRFVIEGKDYSNNPIAVVLSERMDGYYLITVMPPMDESRFAECINS